MRPNLLSLLILLLCLAPWPAWAAASEGLEALATQAVTQSPAVAALDHAIAAARARAVASGAPHNPSLIGQLQLSPQPSNNLLTLGIRQSLDLRGLARQHRAQAEEEVEILSLQREKLVREIRARLAESYWQAWLARVERQRLERDAAWQRSELARAKRAVELGGASGHGVVDAELDALEADLALRDATQQEQGKQALLAHVLGKPPEAPLPFAGAMPDVAPLLPLERWLALAQAEHPEPRQLAIARRREERGVRLAESLRFGSGELEAQAGTAASGDPVVTGAFDLPLPLWYGHEGERAAALADTARLEAELAAARMRISQAVTAAYYEAVSAHARLQDITQRLIPHASHQFEKAEARVTLGSGARTELAWARHALSQAESSRSRALLDVHLSRLRLEAAAGL